MLLPACRQKPGMSQHGQDGLWGTEGETPSFLYAMPLGGNRVFLEETCLVARPALPFATLKRRLERRCRALGIKASASAACWAASVCCTAGCSVPHRARVQCCSHVTALSDHSLV